MTLKDIQSKLDDLTTTEQKATALLDTLAGQIRGNINDPAALQALADQIDATKTDLADAVARDTSSGNA